MLLHFIFWNLMKFLPILYWLWTKSNNNILLYINICLCGLDRIKNKKKCLMTRLDFKDSRCFGLGRKFGHFSGETEILPKLAETETESSVGHYSQLLVPLFLYKSVTIDFCNYICPRLHFRNSGVTLIFCCNNYKNYIL